MSWFSRRPKTKSLAALYDAGAAAAMHGAKNPYNPPRKSGDATRGILWGYGYEDELERLSIQQLV